MDTLHEDQWTLYMKTNGHFTWRPMDTLHEDQWTLYMKTNAHFWQYLFHFFLAWDMFQKNNCIENQNACLIVSNIFLNLVFYETV